MLHYFQTTVFLFNGSFLLKIHLDISFRLHLWLHIATVVMLIYNCCLCSERNNSSYINLIRIPVFCHLKHNNKQRNNESLNFTKKHISIDYIPKKSETRWNIPIHSYSVNEPKFQIENIYIFWEKFKLFALENW